MSDVSQLFILSIPTARLAQPGMLTSRKRLVSLASCLIGTTVAVSAFFADLARHLEERTSMIRFTVVAAASGVGFGIVDGIINGNSLAQRLYEV